MTPLRLPELQHVVADDEGIYRDREVNPAVLGGRAAEMAVDEIDDRSVEPDLGARPALLRVGVRECGNRNRERRDARRGVEFNRLSQGRTLGGQPLTREPLSRFAQ